MLTALIVIVLVGLGILLLQRLEFRSVFPRRRPMPGTEDRRGGGQGQD
jgi:hypothetical protein